MTTDLTPTLCRYINSYLLDKVWNEPFKEYRRNIRPMLLSERSVINVAKLRVGDVQLPTTNTRYHIYSVTKDTFGGVVVAPDVWTSLTDFNNNNQANLKIFSKHGKILFHDGIYIKQDPYNKFLIIAIDKIMYRTILGNNYLLTDIFLELYYDSDTPNDIDMWSSHIKTTTDQQNIFDKISDKTTNILINGYTVSSVGLYDLSIGDYVDIIEDNNITIEFDIDLTINADNRAFLSTQDSMWKQIIHIPKELNTDNKVITHNTCDVYVYTKSSTPGLTIHRAQTTKSFSQITHSDFAIPRYIIEDYQTLLATEEIILKVQCRSHNKNNYLISNNNHIDLLYTHTDKVILDFLENLIDVPFDFWSATELEQCQYTKMLFDVPETIDASNVTDYVNTLGYYQTLSLLCNKIQRYVYKDDLGSPFGIIKPSIYENTPVHIHTYLKGLKVQNTHTEFNHVLSIKLLDIDGASTGDPLTIECHEYPSNNIYEFTPVIGDATIDITYSTYSIYKKVASGTTYQYVNGTSSIKYEELSLTSGMVLSEFTDTGVSLIFTSETYGDTYIIQNSSASYVFNKEIDDLIDTKAPIAIDISKPITGTSNYVPITNTQSVIVHLNRKTLVQDIDYKLIQVQDEDDLILTQLIVQNVSYLTSSDNVVEVFTLPVQPTSIDNTFIKDKYVPKELGMYFPNLSMMCVDGYVVNEMPITGYGYDVDEVGPRKGAICELRTLSSPTIEQYIANYFKTNDLVRRQQLDDYFSTDIDIEDQIVVIPYTHEIYSTYLATIIKDIIDGILVLGIDPDPNRNIVNIPQYEYLKEHDNVFQNPSMDLRYIDQLGSYSNYTSVPVEIYAVIQQLISTVLPVDTITQP